ncbi:MAG: YjbH domain-containing protein [Pseudomonadota bacterium]
MTRARFASFGALVLVSAAATGFLPDRTYAQTAPTLNTFGSTGLVEMPTAEHQPEGEINSTVSYFPGGSRYTLSFQITPRLSGSFRYSVISNFVSGTNATLYDRSFDLRYKVLEETRFLPAVTVGLQDFIGTGVYSGEYIVATKTLHPTLKATLGVGWGRFSSQLRTVNFGTGGSVDSASWFRGDVSAFGGLEWTTPIKGLNLKLEYSSDQYQREATQRGIFSRGSSINFGLNYKVSDGVNLSAYYLYGSEAGMQISFAFNPRKSDFPSGLEPAGLPIKTRPVRPVGGWDTNWLASKPEARITADLGTVLEPSQLGVEAVKLTGSRVIAYIRNDTYFAPSQAAGRTARALTRMLPPSIEVIEVVPVRRGIPIAKIRFRRSDLEALEHAPDGAAQLKARTEILPAGRNLEDGAIYAEGLYPAFNWGITPAVRTSFFDPDAPIRAELGLRLSARYDIAPGLSVSGAVLKPLVGNLDNITRRANSQLPAVRTDARFYFSEGDPALERLTVDYLFKLAPEVYGRVTAGFLETMYGGVSTEILWNPVDKPYAIGVELNYVKQRAFNQRFGFRNYSVATGHVSAYFDLGRDFEAQIDAGRYLAGDWGATFALSRTFNNGWKVGAYATLTDVPFSVFGEGSFDKGILVSVPLLTLFGKPSRDTADLTIRPISRDGGARLKVENRLYEVVGGYDRPTIDASFGRVWR